MRVLFVEDDESQQGLFADAVSDWRRQNASRTIEITKATSVSEAEYCLEKLRIDAAVFDLRLPSSEGKKSAAQSGNHLAHASLARVGIPIGVVSGYPGDLDEDLKA